MRLPDFIVIGAAKCGTTSLFHYLSQHPGIFLPRRKEPSFFAHESDGDTFHGPGDDEWNFVTTLSEYQDLFRGAQRGFVTGDISPRYLYFEQSSRRIAHHAPQARLVAILRHPVDRAYSHFLMNRGRGCEPEADFVKALKRGPERETKQWGWDWQYVKAGLYHAQLERYYDRFPREQIQVFLYDQLKSQPEAVLRELFRHIGVNESFQPDMSARHRPAARPQSYALQTLLRRIDGWVPFVRRNLPQGIGRRLGSSFHQRAQKWNKSPPQPLPEATRSILFERYFAADARKLERLVGAEFAIWREETVGC